MPGNEVILRFNKVSFEYNRKPILQEADFSVREGSKIALMGQNGAGKTTIFQMITGTLASESGLISITKGATIAIARQVIPADLMGLTVKEFFATAFKKVPYDIEPKIAKVLEVVNLTIPLERILRALSGGQQARLLLASALIQDASGHFIAG